MKIKKIKDWIKVKPQFRIFEKKDYYPYLLRLKDNRTFELGQTVITPLGKGTICNYYYDCILIGVEYNKNENQRLNLEINDVS